MCKRGASALQQDVAPNSVRINWAIDQWESEESDGLPAHRPPKDLNRSWNCLVFHAMEGHVNQLADILRHPCEKQRCYGDLRRAEYRRRFRRMFLRHYPAHRNCEMRFFRRNGVNMAPLPPQGCCNRGNVGA